MDSCIGCGHYWLTRHVGQSLWLEGAGSKHHWQSSHVTVLHMFPSPWGAFRMAEFQSPPLDILHDLGGV